MRVPESTRSYNPFSYGDAIALAHNEARVALGMDVTREVYGLNKAGDQMFGVLTLDTGCDDHGLAIGIRQSYNKSLAFGCAVGAQVFVCDNLCFAGSAFKVVRKNTTNAARDIVTLVREQIAESLPNYSKIAGQCDAMREVECDVERGYAVLGVMQGHGLLTPNQASVAFGDWRTPRHEDFGHGDVWGLYNCVTEGLKKGGAGRVLDRHAAAHDFFVEHLIPVVTVDGEIEHMPAREAAAHGIDAAQIGRAMLDDMLTA